jgi:hypothetical protein
MKLKSFKPYLIAAGFAGLLFVGDAIDASTFLGDSLQSANGYFAGTSQRVQKGVFDANRSDPEEIAQELEVLKGTLETTLTDYKLQIEAGEFDAALDTIASLAGIVRGDAQFAQTTEGRVASLEGVCTTERLAELVAGYQQQEDTDYVNGQVQAYLTALESALTDETRSAIAGDRALTAVQEGYVTEQQLYGVLVAAFDGLPTERTLEASGTYMQGITPATRRDFGVTLLEDMPRDEKYVVIDTVMARDEDGLADQLVFSGIDYCSQNTKNNIVIAAWQTLDSDTKMEIVGANVYTLGEGVAQWIGDFVQER